MDRNEALYSRGTAAVALFRQVFQRGSYRIIRDPDGVTSLWTFGREKKPLELTFADRGQISGDLNSMSPEFVRGMLECLERQLGGKAR